MANLINDIQNSLRYDTLNGFYSITIHFKGSGYPLVYNDVVIGNGRKIQINDKTFYCLSNTISFDSNKLLEIYSLKICDEEPYSLEYITEGIVNGETQQKRETYHTFTDDEYYSVETILGNPNEDVNITLSQQAKRIEIESSFRPQVEVTINDQDRTFIVGNTGYLNLEGKITKIHIGKGNFLLRIWK